MYRITAVHKGNLDTCLNEDLATLSSAIAYLAETMTECIELNKTEIRITLTNTRTLKEIAWIQL